MAITPKKILDANSSTCAVTGTAEELGSFIRDAGAVSDKLDKSDVIKQSAVTDSTPDGKAADAKDLKNALSHLSTDNLYNGNGVKVVPLSDNEVRTGDVWTYHEIPPWSYGLAYGNGVLVAADFGPESGIWYSEDLGANWTKSPETDGIRASGYTGACAFGNGTFVVVQDKTTTWTSQDGKHWTRHSIGVEIGYCVFFCNGMFLSSASHSLYMSSNGIDWSRITDVPTELTRICYGDGVYVASNNERIFRSANLTDGFSEITGTSFTGYVNGLVYGRGRFVISYSGAPDGLWYSDDLGLTWKPSNKAGTYTGGVVYGDGRFVAASDGPPEFSGKWYSDDGGETWTHFENSDSSGWGHLGVYVDGRFIFTYSSNSDFSISDRMSVSIVVPIVQRVTVDGKELSTSEENIVNIDTSKKLDASKDQPFSDSEKSTLSTNGGYRYKLATATLAYGTRLIPASGGGIQSITCDYCMVDDYTITTIDCSTMRSSKLLVYLPSALDNRSRDIMLKIKVTSSTPPTFYVVGTGSETVSFASDNDDWATLESGENIILLSETERSN